jgi:hypothetical protein
LAGGAALLAGAIYAEFVADFRTPHSALAMQGSLVTHNKLAPNAIAAATTALKAKFGPATEVSVGFMAINAKLDGEIVGTAQPNGVFHEALGVTQIAGEDGKVSSFPFHIPLRGPRQHPSGAGAHAEDAPRTRL